MLAFNTPLTKVFTLLLLVSLLQPITSCPYLQSTPAMSYDAWGVSDSYSSDGVSSITKIDVTKHVATSSIYSLQVTTASVLLGNPVPKPTPLTVSTPLQSVVVPSCATLSGLKVWTKIQTTCSGCSNC